MSVRDVLRKRKFEDLIFEARAQIANDDYHKALSALEKAHYLGQPYAFSHARVHSMMVYVNFKLSNVVETVGQLFFVFVGFLGSLMGIVLRSNPGRFIGKHAIHP